MSLARRRTWISLLKLTALAVAVAAPATVAAGPIPALAAAVVVTVRLVVALRAGLVGAPPPAWDFATMTGVAHLGVPNPAPTVVWPRPSLFAFVAGDPLVPGVCGFCLSFDTDPGALDTLVPASAVLDRDEHTLYAELDGVRVFAAHRGSLRVVLTPADTATLVFESPTDPNEPYRATVSTWLSLAETLGATPAQLAEMRHQARFERPLVPWDTLGSRLYQHRRRIAAMTAVVAVVAATGWAWRTERLTALMARFDDPPPSLAHEHAERFENAWRTASDRGVAGKLGPYLTTWSFPDGLQVRAEGTAVLFDDGVETCRVETSPASLRCSPSGASQPPRSARRSEQAPAPG
jgi:hypothetical protein